MATGTQKFVLASALLASAGCATNGPRPFSSGSTYQQDNTTAITAGVGTAAAVHLAGAPHAAAAGFLVASVLKLTGAFSAKDYCSSRSVQVVSSRAYANGVPIDGGVENFRQTECVQSNLTFRPGDMIPVVYDASKGPANKADQIFEVVEQRRTVDPFSGAARFAPLVRDVTACEATPQNSDAEIRKAAEICRASQGKTYLMHAFTRESVNQTTGEKAQSNVIFLNQVNVLPGQYSPPRQYQPAAVLQQHNPYTQGCTPMGAVIAGLFRGDCRVTTRDLQGLGGTAPQ